MFRLAILGAGGIARSMARTVRMMREAGRPVELYAVGSRSPEKAEAFAKAEGVTRAYGSYEELVSDGAIDLVYIATPHSEHARHAALCVEHSLPVLVEKAFAANEAQARQAIGLAESRGVFLTEAIWTRYMPSRRMVDELIASGAIGEPYLLTANLGYAISRVPRILDPALAGGALLDVGVYALNFASMCFGDGIAKTDAAADLFPTGVDRTVSLTLRYTDGRMAQLHACAQVCTDRRGIVYGSEGFLEVDNINNPSAITLCRGNDHTRPERVLRVPAQLTGYEYQVEACMRAIAAGELSCPEMPHAETLEIMRQMDGIRAQLGIRYPFE